MCLSRRPVRENRHKLTMQHLHPPFLYMHISLIHLTLSMPSRMGDRFQVGDFVAVHGGTWIGHFGSIKRTTLWSYVLHLDKELTRPCSQTNGFVWEVTIRKWSVRAQSEDEKRENGTLKRESVLSFERSMSLIRANMNSSSTAARDLDAESEIWRNKCRSDHGILPR